jgi:glycoside/pentoside/hexuronide:cation symporter, GPH family
MHNIASVPVPTKLRFSEKFGYGCGDAASNFIWASMTTFLLFFYTDIFGIPAAAVGTLFLFARVSDGFVDLVVGAIADRTQTRWGKFRPYLVWFCIPMAAIFIATFTTPNFSVDGKIIYAWITYNLLMIIYTAINLPYGALSGVMTDDPLDRTSLNSFRMTGAQVGSLTVNALMLPLIAFFGHGDKALGCRWTVILFAIIATLLFLATFFLTKERIQPPPEQKENLLQDIKCLFSNKPWILMFIAGAGTIFNVVRGGATIYYCKYYLGIDETKEISIFGLFNTNELSLYLIVGSIGFIVGAVNVRHLVKIFGKKDLFIFSLFAMAAGCAAFFFIPQDGIFAVFVAQIVLGLIGGVNAPLYFAMIGDTADYAEWKFNIRTTGIIFSATSCAQKIGLGIGGAASGYLLKDYGYIAGVAQSAATNHGIVLMISLTPAVGYALVGAIFFLYPLDEAFCHTIREDLERRRGLIT